MKIIYIRVTLTVCSTLQTLVSNKGVFRLPKNSHLHHELRCIIYFVISTSFNFDFEANRMLNSTNFEALKMKLQNAMIFQVLHDPHGP